MRVRYPPSPPTADSFVRHTQESSDFASASQGAQHSHRRRHIFFWRCYVVIGIADLVAEAAAAVDHRRRAPVLKMARIALPADPVLRMEVYKVNHAATWHSRIESAILSCKGLRYPLVCATLVACQRPPAS